MELRNELKAPHYPGSVILIKALRETFLKFNLISVKVIKEVMK